MCLETDSSLVQKHDQGKYLLYSLDLGEFWI